MSDGHIDKHSEIFERNSKSPLMLRAAEKEIKEKNFDRGIEILESLLNESPMNAAAYFLAGQAYSGKGNFREALLNFRKGSELIKSEKTYQYYLKEIELQKRKWEESDVSIERINPSDYAELLSTPSGTASHEHVTNAEDSIISETLAKIYLSQNEKTEAIKIYEKLIKKYPLKKLYFEAKIAEIYSVMK